MEIIRPKKLKKGDTIGLLSISGVIENPAELLTAKQRLEKSGYNVVISKTSYTKNRYICGTQKECLDSLYSFFEDKNIDAIISTRGGFGTLKLLDTIDYSIIKNNPKIFVGYSDITNLLAMFYKNTGLVCFHGAMALSDFASNFDKVAYYSMFNVLEGNEAKIIAKNKQTINKGKSKGILWGGNLATLSSMAGLDFVPEDDFILFVEDWHEPVYKIDRMMTQLLNVKTFRENIKGIALGEFVGIDDENYFKEWLSELNLTLNIPICSGFKITHGENKLTLPVGIKTTFDADNGEILFDEEYVI